MRILPVALWGIVTQFLPDRDNHHVLSTCKEATLWLQAAPRIAQYRVRINNCDRTMYGRCTNVLVDLSYYAWDEHDPYRMPIRPVVRLFDFVARMRHWLVTLTLDNCIMGAQNDPNFHDQVFEIAVVMAPLPEFPLVRTLDVRRWHRFRAFDRFPNCESLLVCTDRLDILPLNPPPWPDMPHLTRLVWRANTISLWGNGVSIPLPENWTTVEYLETETDCVPETYNCLKTCFAPFAEPPRASWETLTYVFTSPTGAGVEQDYTEFFDPKIVPWMPKLERLVVRGNNDERNPWTIGVQ